MGKSMLKFVSKVLLPAGALVLAGGAPSWADGNAAVCAQTYGKSDGLACNYASYEQCRAAVSGIAGGCIDNPYLRAGSSPAQPQKRGRR